MSPLPAVRLDHLRRLTDSRGIIHAAIDDCPDRSRGYDSIDNADALRLCAVASDTVSTETLDQVATTCFGFLSRARLEDGRVRHGCNASGNWVNDREDSLVQSRLARALAAVIVSELPIKLRLAAAEWWSQLLPQADLVGTPVSAANWLIGFGALKTADPGRDLGRTKVLANWLVEECYDRTRETAWEWFAPQWSPEAACIPAGLWHASAMLDDTRLAKAARTTTLFVIENMFQGDRFVPVGTRGGWSPHTGKAAFDQTPSEAGSIIELCRTAQALSGEKGYHTYALKAAAWFTGSNSIGLSLIDPIAGGCCRAIRPDGLDRNRDAPATLAYLLARARLSEPARVEPGHSHIMIG